MNNAFSTPGVKKYFAFQTPGVERGLIKQGDFQVKKCLGCGQKFDGDVGICQNCFSGIENVRNQFDSFPRGFQTKPILLVRKFILIIAILTGILLFAISLGAAIVIPLAPTGKINLLNLMVILSPVIILIIFGIIGCNLGKILSVSANKKLFKIWSNKDWYSVSVWSWRYTKFWLPETLLLFIFVIVVPMVYNIIITTVIFMKPESVYCPLFYKGVGLGFSFLNVGLFIGFAIGNYFCTNWVSKLPK